MSQPSESDPVPALGRRAFLRLAGAATIAGALPAAATALAQSATPATPPPVGPKGAPADTSHAAVPAKEEPSEDAKALAAILKRRFPDRLTDAQWAAVTEELDGRLGAGRRLKDVNVKQANGDEPDFAFRA